MKAAAVRSRREGRLLVLDTDSGQVRHRRPDDLAGLLVEGDVVVVNDAATLPASVPLQAEGLALEARLVAPLETFAPCDDGPGEPTAGAWWVVLFGEGSWRDDTDQRPAPPRLARGARVTLGAGRRAATVVAVSCRSPRLIGLRFDDADPVLAAYELGAPIQYAYHAGPLTLASVQTAYADRPWAVEMPSAGRVLTPDRLFALRDAGVQVHALTHGAGLSATGDPSLDARLPLPERFEIPEATARAVQSALREGRRVIAVGTSVVRALEGSAGQHGGAVRAGRGVTDLVIREGYVPRVVSGLLSGVHVPGESHHALLGAFGSAPALARALAAARAEGYQNHEFGDAFLIVGAPRYAGAEPWRPTRSETSRAASTPSPA